MDIEARNKLVDENRGLVGFILKRYFPAWRFTDDALQDGFLALIKAADRFDPSRGIKFSTFACKCIWARLACKPPSQERFERSAKQFVACEDLREPIVDDDPVLLALAEESLALSEEQCRDALRRMTDREKRMLMMRVVDDMTLEQVGAEFGVCKERVRQVVDTAIDRLNPLRAPEKKAMRLALRKSRYKERVAKRLCGSCGEPSKRHVCDKCRKRQKRNEQARKGQVAIPRRKPA